MSDPRSRVSGIYLYDDERRLLAAAKRSSYSQMSLLIVIEYSRFNYGGG